MTKLKRILSINKKKFIDVVETENGRYELQQYVKKYDSEEKVYYVVRELPGPLGKYGDLESAIIEAETIIQFI